MNMEPSASRVLVAAGSKHGSTTEIATRIAERLTASGLYIEVRDADDVGNVSDYDAFVIGSAVYTGHWTDSAREVARLIGERSDAPPVWLFSSGPVGDPPRPDEDAVDLAEVVAATHPREHVTFGGKIDKSVLGLGERAIVAAVRSPVGDFRDWAAIDAWADGIAAELGGTIVPQALETIERIGVT